MEEVIHKRKVGNTNGALCKKIGKTIYLSTHVTCKKCLALIRKEVP